MVVSFCLEVPAADALNARIVLRSKMHECQKVGSDTSYCAAVNYLFWTYGTDDVIAKTDANMMRFTQPPSKCPTEYADALWNKALR